MMTNVVQLRLPRQAKPKGEAGPKPVRLLVRWVCLNGRKGSKEVATRDVARDAMRALARDPNVKMAMSLYTDDRGAVETWVRGVDGVPSEEHVMIHSGLTDKVTDTGVVVSRSPAGFVLTVRLKSSGRERKFYLNPAKTRFIAETGGHRPSRVMADYILNT